MRLAPAPLPGIQVPAAAEFVFSVLRERKHKPEFMKIAGGDGIAVLSPEMRARGVLTLIELSKSVFAGYAWAFRGS